MDPTFDPLEMMAVQCNVETGGGKDRDNPSTEDGFDPKDSSFSKASQPSGGRSCEYDPTQALGVIKGDRGGKSDKGDKTRLCGVRGPSGGLGDGEVKRVKTPRAGPGRGWTGQALLMKKAAEMQGKALSVVEAKMGWNSALSAINEMKLIGSEGDDIKSTQKSSRFDVGAAFLAGETVGRRPDSGTVVASGVSECKDAGRHIRDYDASCANHPPVYASMEITEDVHSTFADDPLYNPGAAEMTN